jgi:hypothetical protein
VPRPFKELVKEKNGIIFSLMLSLASNSTRAQNTLEVPIQIISADSNTLDNF